MVIELNPFKGFANKYMQTHTLTCYDGPPNKSAKSDSKKEFSKIK